MKVPYVNLKKQHQAIKQKLLDAIDTVLTNGNFVLGSEVEEFEKKIAAYCGANYAIALNSGTDALFLALKTYGIGAGDEVILPPNSFLASASSIVACGARPVFADVREDLNIDPAKIEEKISARTKAIMPVHLTGRPADMDPINAIAKKYNLKVIEDSAQAIGAKYKGKKVGSLGDMGCFSLHPLKTLNACGDGGLITTNDKAAYETLIKLRNIGLKNRNESDIWGYNSRLDTMQAAILLVKLDYLDQWNEKRKANAKFYQEHLSPCIQTPKNNLHEDQVFHTYVLQVDSRDDLQSYLQEQGVETKIHYPILIHKQQVFENYFSSIEEYPVAERTNRQILSLPIHQDLTEKELEWVVEKINSFHLQTV